jgi:hypothetical protein
VQLKAFTELSDADLLHGTVELFQHIESMRNGLDRVIGFLAPNHVSSSVNVGV